MKVSSRKEVHVILFDGFPEVKSSLTQLTIHNNEFSPLKAAQKVKEINTIILFALTIVRIGQNLTLITNIKKLYKKNFRKCI